jgi:hypothetical protein
MGSADRMPAVQQRGMDVRVTENALLLAGHRTHLLSILPTRSPRFCSGSMGAGDSPVLKHRLATAANDAASRTARRLCPSPGQCVCDVNKVRAGRGVPPATARADRPPSYCAHLEEVCRSSPSRRTEITPSTSFHCCSEHSPPSRYQRSLLRITPSGLAPATRWLRRREWNARTAAVLTGLVDTCRA